MNIVNSLKGKVSYYYLKYVHTIYCSSNINLDVRVLKVFHIENKQRKKAEESKESTLLPLETCLP